MTDRTLRAFDAAFAQIDAMPPAAPTRDLPEQCNGACHIDGDRCQCMPAPAKVERARQLLARACDVAAGPMPAGYDDAMLRTHESAVCDPEMLPERQLDLHSEFDAAGWVLCAIAGGVIGFVLRGWL